MGYGRAPKFPAYNLQSVVDIESGLIIHNDVANEANDSQLLHPMAIAAKQVLDVDQLEVLADGGYSNAQEVALRARWCSRGGTDQAWRHERRILPPCAVHP